MDDDLTEFPTQRLRLQPCPNCGRKFNAESLKKHQAICRKVAKKKRNVFDAGKQRARDSDVPYKATRRTAQIYNGDVPAQDDRPRGKSKANWREKHTQLIRSIREARSVTRAMKEGGPLPAFRPSEIPSDYVMCPHCRRNFNEHAGQRHIPFCQAQHQRKQVQPSRPNQQYDRGRTLPPQNSSAYKQQSSNLDMYSGPHDVYNNGYKHSNSAPMLVRRNPAELQPPPPPRQSTGGGWGGFRKLFGLGPKEEPLPPTNYYGPEDEDDYEPPARRPVQQPVLMRTGRTQENTSLNVRARQGKNEGNPNMRRIPPPPAAPSSYRQTRPQYGNNQSQYGNNQSQYGNNQSQYGNNQSQYGNNQSRHGNNQSQYGNNQSRHDNNQYSSTRPTAAGRPPVQSSGVRCGDCGSMFNNATARYCPQCGSRR